MDLDSLMTFTTTTLRLMSGFKSSLKEELNHPLETVMFYFHLRTLYCFLEEALGMQEVISLNFDLMRVDGEILWIIKV